MNGSIIVYHNPVQQWFWDGGWVTVIGICGVSVIAYVLIRAAVEMFNDFRKPGSDKSEWK